MFIFYTNERSFLAAENVRFIDTIFFVLWCEKREGDCHETERLRHKQTTIWHRQKTYENGEAPCPLFVESIFLLEKCAFLTGNEYVSC